ncbi:potassium channel tetramerization domain-containing protein [Capsaspora owczarzaki ATCC 30864]|uniref:Potassium channel tetramerization domain-containing protein n=1 Tax=Capsaspora owczarzaki (strain ATCC 30864) TaxID=595528 RepID=A0A0D2U014_CAPO3|nr:potassium channel tetramerization domain-containing protein [Capsaspora owczarzaki ATCC 30864]
MSGFQEQLLQQQQQQQQQRHWQSPSSLQQQQQNSFQHYGEIAGGNGSSGSSVSSVSGSGSLTGASFALHQHHNQHQHQQPFVFPQHQQQPPATTALNSSPFAGGSGAGTGGLQASSRVTRLSQSLPPLSPTASPAATVQPCPPPAAAAAAATPTGVGSGATIPSTELGGVGVAPRPFQLVQRALASSSSTSTSSASASPVAASPQSRNLFVDVQPAVYAPASSGATFPHAVGPRTPQLASSAAQPVPAEASVAVAAPSIHVTSDAASGGANTSSEPAASSTKDGSVVSQNPSHHTLPTATDRKTSGLSLHLPGASAAAGLPLPKTDNAGTATVASRVVIVVRGHRYRYRVDPAMFQRYPDTMLARMFGSAFDMCKTNTTGEYEIEQPVSPAIFRAVLDYYATGLIVCPENEHVGDLREACDYFLLPFDMSTVRVQDLGKILKALFRRQL